MKVKRRRKFRRIGTGAVTKGESIKTYYPQRGFSLESEFVVPLFFSVFMGSLSAILVTIGVIYMAPDLTWWPTLPVLFLAITGIAFFFKHNAASETCWQVEERPIEPELEEEKPEPAPVTDRAIVVNAPNVRDFNEPAEPEPALVEEPDVVDQELEDFRAFIRGCEVGSTGLRRWEPVIGRETYNTYRDQLMEAGFAAWKNPENEKNGWKLTYSADIICQALSVMSR